MPAPAEVAALSDLLPPEAASARRWLAWIPRPRRRTARGLAAVPERYRLQFLLLAADRLPGCPRAEAAALADRLAARIRIPARLLADEHPEPLDEWFRDHAEDILAALDKLSAA